MIKEHFEVGDCVTHRGHPNWGHATVTMAYAGFYEVSWWGWKPPYTRVYGREMLRKV